MLDSVFGFKVALRLPATVTSPGFTGCVKCRCEPDVRFTRQPSGSSSRMISLIFMGTEPTVTAGSDISSHVALRFVVNGTFTTNIGAVRMCHGYRPVSCPGHVRSRVDGRIGQA